MIDAPFIVMAGVLGSAHCVGMCGGFALTLGTQAASWRNNLLRQGIYSLGRLFTYAVLGAIAGFAGKRLADSTPLLVHASAVLSLVAGAILVWQGLLTLGWWPRRWVKAAAVGGKSACQSLPFLATFLRSNRVLDTLLAGVFTGLLPCGLLYGMVMLAASRQHFAEGILLMVLFGLGTVPLMVLTGQGATLLGLAARRRLFQAAAVCLLITGLISGVRGASFLVSPSDSPDQCPLCIDQE